MRIGTRCAMGIDDPHDAVQRLSRRCVAVDHAERLTIVLPHPDLEAGHTGVRISDRTTHFETSHFTGQYAVFDADRGTRFDDERFELTMLDRHLGRCRMRFGHGRQQRTIVAMPHLNVEIEGLGTTGQESGRFRRDHMKGAQLVATRPRKGGTESTLGLFIDQNEGRIVGDSGGTTRQASGGCERFDAELLAHERLQSESEKTRTTIGIVSETGHG